MTGGGVTMSQHMIDSESSVGGVPSADPLSFSPEQGAGSASVPPEQVGTGTAADPTEHGMGPAAGAPGHGTGSAAEAPEHRTGSAAEAPERSTGSAAEAEPEVEVVDGLPVLAEVRTVERAAPATLPAVQVAAVAATGFVAGAATVALVKRRTTRKMVRSGRGGPRRPADLLPIAATRSFLVDVHVIAKPE